MYLFKLQNEKTKQNSDSVIESPWVLMRIKGHRPTYCYFDMQQC